MTSLVLALAAVAVIASQAAAGGPDYGYEVDSQDSLALLGDLELPSDYHENIGKLVNKLAVILAPAYANSERPLKASELDEKFSEEGDGFDWDAPPYSAIAEASVILDQVLPNGLVDVFSMSQDEIVELVDSLSATDSNSDPSTDSMSESSTESIFEFGPDSIFEFGPDSIFEFGPDWISEFGTDAIFESDTDSELESFKDSMSEFSTESSTVPMSEPVRALLLSEEAREIVRQIHFEIVRAIQYGMSKRRAAIDNTAHDLHCSDSAYEPLRPNIAV